MKGSTEDSNVVLGIFSDQDIQEASFGAGKKFRNGIKVKVLVDGKRPSFSAPALPTSSIFDILAGYLSWWTPHFTSRYDLKSLQTLSSETVTTMKEGSQVLPLFHANAIAWVTIPVEYEGKNVITFLQKGTTS